MGTDTIRLVTKGCPDPYCEGNGSNLIYWNHLEVLIYFYVYFFFYLYNILYSLKISFYYAQSFYYYLNLLFLIY